MSIDVLARNDEDADPGARRPRSWLAIGGAAALVLALVGGVTYGFNALSGGGTRPAEALPAGAFAYGEIDLDPSAGQKIDAFRFLRQFPALREKLSTDDLREAVFEAVAEDAGWAAIDYASQVEPWLGQRLAVAVYPPDKLGAGAAGSDVVPSPTLVVALQVTDAAEAETGLRRLVDASNAGSGPGFVVSGDYAVLAETREIAERAAEAAGESDLAGSEPFAGDMSALGDGVASAWFDLEAAGGLAGLANPLALGAAGNLAGVTTAAGATGRAAYVARFDGPDAFEVAGRLVDANAIDAVEPAALQGLAELPASSVAVFGLAGGDELVAPMWEGLRKQFQQVGGDFDEMVAEAERSLGMDLPQDLEVVLGSNLLAVLDSSGLGAGRIELGVRTTTDPQRAAPIVDRMTRLLQEAEPGVRSRMTDDGYVVASSEAALRRLTRPADQALGESDAVRRALPDLAEARMALWLDVKPLIAGFAFGGPSEVDPNLEPIAGFGMTMSTDGGTGSFRMRLVTH